MGITGRFKSNVQFIKFEYKLYVFNVTPIIVPLSSYNLSMTVLMSGSRNDLKG